MKHLQPARRECLMVAVAFGLTALMPSLLMAQRPDTPAKPNVILIMADDLGYECIGANGSDDYNTPALDKLASNGVRFTNCFANPVCTPG